MTASEIKEYLGICKNLEEEIYTQDIAIGKLVDEQCLLGISKKYAEPVPKINKESVSVALCGEAVAIVSAIAAVFGFFIGSELFFFGGLMGLVGGIAVDFGGRQDYRRAINKAEKKYNDDMKQYHKALAMDARRVQLENAKKAALEVNIDALQAARERTSDYLEKLYSKNVLYSKYRGYASVCTLYEYFDSRRCTTLEGHEGAYNLLENELRLNRIIIQNDQILTSLETIKVNQELLYDSIQESNHKADQIIQSCERMSNQLNSIRDQDEELNARIANLQVTSDVNLYINACAKRELEYMNRANRIF